MVDLKINYGQKREILRKLMIAQRKQFLFKKEQLELNKMKDKFADTSISNFSQISGHINGGEDNKEFKCMNENENKAENYKFD